MWVIAAAVTAAGVIVLAVGRRLSTDPAD